VYGEVVAGTSLISNANANELILENTALKESDISLLLGALPTDDLKAKLSKEIQSKYKFLKLDRNGNYGFSNEDEYDEKSIIGALVGEKADIKAKVALTTIYEVPLSYASAWKPFESRNDLSIGGNFKYIYVSQALTYVKLNKAKNPTLPTAISKSGFGLDIGSLYMLNNDGFSDGLAFGLVAKNLNSPSFKLDDETIKLEPQIRVGISYPMLNNFLEFALDYDITDNKHTASEYTSKYLSYGVNIEVASWLGLRGGM
jgi:hypothetical protein